MEYLSSQVCLTNRKTCLAGKGYRPECHIKLKWLQLITKTTIILNINKTVQLKNMYLFPKFLWEFITKNAFGL